MIAEALLAGTLLTGPLVLPCQDLPEEPDMDTATSEGPKGISGLYEFDYDLGGGRWLLTLHRIMDVPMDAGLTATYTLQAHPFMYVVIVPGMADVIHVDRGHGLLGVPQGLCGEIVRYQ
jgi:hypothetical protein